jgi:hypothetical protein
MLDIDSSLKQLVSHEDFITLVFVTTSDPLVRVYFFSLYILIASPKLFPQVRFEY